MSSGFVCLNTVTYINIMAVEYIICFICLQSFQLPNWTEILIHPPDHPSKPVVDIPLHIPFLCLSADQILEVVSALMTQQSIVFLSSDYALLTPCIEVNTLVLSTKVHVTPHHVRLLWQIL